jgi:hypothetical protein
MITTTLLTMKIFLTPVATQSGPLGNFGLKATEKISENVYFKARIFEEPLRNNLSQPKLKVYFDYDF